MAHSWPIHGPPVAYLWPTHGLLMAHTWIIPYSLNNLAKFLVARCQLLACGPTVAGRQSPTLGPSVAHLSPIHGLRPKLPIGYARFVYCLSIVCPFFVHSLSNGQMLGRQWAGTGPQAMHSLSLTFVQHMSISNVCLIFVQ